MDPYEPPLDDGSVALSGSGNLAGCKVGLHRFGMGWILGVGSCRECVSDAVADWHGFPAFRDYAGAQRHDENLEHGSHPFNLLAVHFGTFLTRSGIVSSVHAFAQSPIGPYFTGFLLLLLGLSLYLLLTRIEALKSENRLDAVLSRESSFMFNNLVLLATGFAILWGTLFPVLSEA